MSDTHPHKFKITEIRSIQLSLVIIFVALGVIAAIINFNFQVASQQRIETLNLTKAIHDSDLRNSKDTDLLIKNILSQIYDVSADQKNSTKQITDILLDNQRIIKDNQFVIKNTTGLNLKSTFINRKNIQDLIDAVKSFNLTQVKNDQILEVEALANLNLKLDKLLGNNNLTHK